MRKKIQKTLRQVTLFVVCILTSLISFAGPTDNLLRAEFLKIDTKPDGSPSRFVMHTKRYRRDGAQPIVLAHGFLNNDEAMDVWARKFY